MSEYFIALLVLYSIVIGNSLSNHGKKTIKVHNFWATLVGAAIQIFLIYKAVEVGY